MSTKLLYAVVCGAGPAGGVDRLIHEAQHRDWSVRVIATPSALPFIDVEDLEAMTGYPVRSEYRKPGEPRSDPADAIVVAPGTFNTINKLANGISDTYALGVVGEAIGLGLQVVVIPFINTALAARRPLIESVQRLRDEGVKVLLGPGGVEPHEPHTGGDQISSFPWKAALDELASRKSD